MIERRTQKCYDFGELTF